MSDELARLISNAEIAALVEIRSLSPLAAIVAQDVARICQDRHEAEIARLSNALAAAQAERARLRAALETALRLLHVPEHAQDEEWERQRQATEAALAPALDGAGDALLAAVWAVLRFADAERAWSVSLTDGVGEGPAWYAYVEAEEQAIQAADALRAAGWEGDDHA